MMDPSYAEPDWLNDPQCMLCDAAAEYVTVDQDVLCERCAYETQAEIRIWLGDVS